MPQTLPCIHHIGVLQCLLRLGPLLGPGVEDLALADAARSEARSVSDFCRGKHVRCLYPCGAMISFLVAFDPSGTAYPFRKTCRLISSPKSQSHRIVCGPFGLRRHLNLQNRPVISQYADKPVVPNGRVLRYNMQLPLHPATLVPPPDFELHLSSTRIYAAQIQDGEAAVGGDSPVNGRCAFGRIHLWIGGRARCTSNVGQGHRSASDIAVSGSSFGQYMRCSLDDQSILT